MSDWDKLVKEVSREVRDARDWAAKHTGEYVEAELIRRINEFWAEQPFWAQLFRKPIMQYAYKLYKKLTK